MIALRLKRLRKNCGIIAFLIKFCVKIFGDKMILFDNRVGVEVGSETLALLESIAEFTMKSSKFNARNIELLLVSNDEIRALNAEFLGKDYATDVLSFPLDSSGIIDSSGFVLESNESNIVSNADSRIDSPLDSPKLPLGSVVIAYEIADSVAKAQNHSLQTELAILFTHGLLHLLGYNHECDNGEHRQKEREILAHFGIKSTLISRNS